MQGLMGELPLTLDLLARRAEQWFPRKDVITAVGGGALSRTSYRDWAARARRVGGAMEALGVSADGRVGSLCWSTQEHLELYFGVPGSGRVLHTLNPRFSPGQLAFVINEAQDEVVFVHASLAGVLLAVLPGCPSVAHVVVIDDGVPSPEGPAGVQVHSYEELLEGADEAELAVDDERRAAVLCYTGGTTGDPKGVLYSHRSLVLHALAVMSASGIGITERDVAMPVVPLFHANAVGFAHAAVATGATLVLPGRDLSGGALADLIEQQRVSVTCGVPTVWSAVLPALAGRPVPNLRTIISGASAVPPSLSEQFAERVGVPLTQIWGMTETSPLGTIVSVVSERQDASAQELVELRASVGLPVAGVEARVVDDEGRAVDRDGASSGELQVRGPWVASGYFGGRSPESFTDDGWLRTGDIATVDEHGYVRIVDRAKDVIKSGGEWISSITLENHLMSHPEVAEAAVVAVDDEKWGERPKAYVVPVEGASPDPEQLAGFLAERVPTWWVPERWEVIDEIPKTSVGKFSKATLRARDEASPG